MRSSIGLLFGSKGCNASRVRLSQADCLFRGAKVYYSFQTLYAIGRNTLSNKPPSFLITSIIA